MSRSAKPNIEAETLVRTGYELSVGGNAERAADCYARAISITPGQPAWVFLDLARLLKEQGKDAEAERYLEMLLARHRSRPEAPRDPAGRARGDRWWRAIWRRRGASDAQSDAQWLFHRAKALLALKRLAQARDELGALLRQDPASLHAYAGLTELAHIERDWEGVLRHTAAYLDLAPERTLPAELTVYRADAYLALGRGDEARADLLRVARELPQARWIYVKLSELEEALGQREQAIAYCDICIEDAPNEAQRYERLWSLLRHRGDLRELAQRYSAVCERLPTDTIALVKLGGLYELLREPAKAAETFDRARQAGFRAPWLDRRYINALADSGDIDAAEAEVHRMLSGSGQERERIARLASLALRTRRFDIALERWRGIETMAGESVDVLRGEALALIGLERTAEAAQRLGRIVAAWPESLVGHEESANLFLRLKDWPQALACLEAALALRPNNLELQAKKGDALLALGRLAEAQAIFKDIERAAGQTFWVLPRLARAARLTGDIDACLACCRMLIERFPALPTGYYEAEQTYIDLGMFDKANDVYLSRPDSAPAPERERPEGLPPDLKLPPLVGKGNDYSFIDDRVRRLRASGEQYALPVSIIIPVYNRKNVLARTLAALTHQTYPRHLIEVVVADDGSSDGVESVIRKYGKLLSLKYVYQEDRGYRLAAVRNLGMKAASHDYFIVLDCDMLPLPELVESYMRYFHVSRQAVLMGHRRFVHADHLDDDAILKDIGTILTLPDIEIADAASASAGPRKRYDWRLSRYVRSDYNKRQLWAFIGCNGGNLALSREAVERVGGYDEEFRAWGSEDNEMGYRLFNAGYYFIPAMEAVALHQEPPGGENETNREAGLKITRSILEEKCPTPTYRAYEPGRIYQVPKVSIYIPAYNAGKYIKAAIDSALAQTYTDLDVCICDDGSTDNTWQLLAEHYDDNPRVHWISQAHAGIGSASNAAVRLCRGMYIGQLDADDMLKPNAVEVAVAYLDNHDVGCVYTTPEIVDADGQPVGLGYSRNFSREALLCSMVVGAFRMFRKREWLRTAGFAEDLEHAVDYDMFLKLAEVCDFHHIATPTYCYRSRGENTGAVRPRTQESDRVIAIDRALQRMGLSDWEAVADGTPDRREIRLRKRAEAASGAEKPSRTAAATAA